MIDRETTGDITNRMLHHPASGHRLSEVLAALAADESRERIFIGDLFRALGDRAFGALLLIFALPNVVPTPPGTSAILGLPLVILSAQLMLGQSPWLPKLIAGRSIARADFAAMVVRISPWLARGERLLKPRLAFAVSPVAEHAIGLLCLVLALVLALPIPLGNILPALSICLFSFALLERDGLFSLAGLAAAIVSLLVLVVFYVGLIRGFLYLLAQALH